MGMDVFGRDPSAPAGKYFVANFWAWRPIHALIIDLCSDLLDEEMLVSMILNDGAGPVDQQTCTEMANRFERWMEHHTQGHRLESDVRVTPHGRFVSAEELAENPDLETVSPYEVEDEHLKQWVEFHRRCGGFEVW
jgi:hypothetical protein